MTIHVHRLAGCTPVPLAYYLKALGILRLVGEQADPEARGAWQDEIFLLSTLLDGDQLEEFFLARYQPTPLLSPWNKGCGFFKKNDPGLDPLEHSPAPRFKKFADAIREMRHLVRPLADADNIIREIKAEPKKQKDLLARKRRREDPDYKQRLLEAEKQYKALKDPFILLCRENCRGPLLEWINAAVSILPKKEGDEVEYPALVGTGGNDGNFDFTNNFMQRLGDLFDLDSIEGKSTPAGKGMLEAALWGTKAPTLRRKLPIGQYFPGSAGGANSSTGPEGDSSINPWDFVLAMEGTVLFSAHVSKRMSPVDIAQASAPFAVCGQAVGYASASPEEESIQRGEQWMPLWSRFMSLGELRRLLAEGRAQIGRRSATRPIELIQAVSRLGVARGLTGFQRFAYLERQGQSKLAIPLGRIEVRERPHARLLEDINPWMERLSREARAQDAPARLVAVERRLADAVFSAITHEHEPSRWQAVLLAMAEVESIQASGTGFAAGPIPRLSPEWAAAARDDSPEFRLALALGGAHVKDGSSKDESSKDGPSRDSLRGHWLPLTQSMRSYSVSKGRLSPKEPVIAHGRDPVADLLAVVGRRIMKSGKGASRRLPILPATHAAARMDDLAALIAGSVDLERTVGMGRALMALDWYQWTRQIETAADHPPPGTPKEEMPDDAWLAIRIALMPWPINEKQIPADPAIVRRLEAGDGGVAVELAVRRLQTAGIYPTLSGAIVDPARARQWGAALAFPITSGAAYRAACRIDPTFKGKE